MGNVRAILACALPALAALSAAQGAAKAFDVMVGDPAPKLTISKWVKGEPVKEFEKGKVYVVEFWATWCGPCKVSIPHITELQHKYADKVKFVGVSVWETKQSDVEPFVKEMGDKMGYTIAMDSLPTPDARMEGAMAKDWMAAAGQNGIPAAFIVNGEGRIAWIGHPMTIDEPLAKVVDGSWDLEAFAEQHRKEMETAAAMRRVQKKLGDAIKAKDWDAALSACDEMAEAGEVVGAGMNRFIILLNNKKDTDAAYAVAKDLIAGPIKDNSGALNQLAWMIVDPKGKVEKKDLDVALAAAQRSVEVQKMWANLDTLARVYFVRGDKAKAIELEKEAISMAPDEESKKELQAALDEYSKG